MSLLVSRDGMPVPVISQAYAFPPITNHIVVPSVVAPRRSAKPRLVIRRLLSLVCVAMSYAYARSLSSSMNHIVVPSVVAPRHTRDVPNREPQIYIMCRIGLPIRHIECDGSIGKRRNHPNGGAVSSKPLRTRDPKCDISAGNWNYCRQPQQHYRCALKVIIGPSERFAN